MLFVSVDVEANGPCPGLFSMTSFGAVVVEPAMKRTFLAALKPIPYAGIAPRAAAIAAKAESTLVREDPYAAMFAFKQWLESLNDRVVFVSDNPAFDWQFINYYFWLCCRENPFGHSARRIGDLFCGAVGDLRASWKHLRKTKHDHNPLNDAIGNAEAMLTILSIMARKQQMETV